MLATLEPAQYIVGAFWLFVGTCVLLSFAAVKYLTQEGK